MARRDAVGRGMLYAACVPVLIFLLLQRYFVKGLLEGGLKG